MSTAAVALARTDLLAPGSQEVEGIMRYDMEDVVVRFALEHDVPIDVARELERELKRFLALSAIAPKGGSGYGMCGPVDELWHSFILDTVRYSEFCRETAGRYIHHVPGRSEESSSGYVRFLEDYQLVFGEAAPVHIWPLPWHEDEFVPDCRGPAGCKSE